MSSAHVQAVIGPRVAPFTATARGRLKAMFETHHELIWRALRHRGFEAEVAADLTQQAFLIAAERLDDIRVGCERAFLLETSFRLARSTSRKTSRLQLEEDMDLRRTSTMGADDALDHKRAADLVERVLATMTPDLLEVFLLFELERVSTREIAQLLGIPVGTVASRLRRAREEFREEAGRIERTVLGRSKP